MNRIEFIVMAKDVHEHPERLAYYRKKYKNVYPFSDGIFKMLLANEAKPERTVKFLNAMLGLTGEKAIKSYTLGVPENPGVLNDKTAIFDIYGTTQAGEPVLIEVQQNFNTLFVDRLLYYTARVVSRTVKKSQDYNLPHIYVLSILTEDLFESEPDTYFHHVALAKNGRPFYRKFDGFLVEVDKFREIDKRTPEARRERSERADMLRFLIDLMEEKPFSDDILQNEMYAKFVKDVSLEKIEDELLLREVGDMTDIKYEKESSYLDGIRDTAKRMIADGKLSNEEIASYSGLSIEDVVVLRSQAET